MYTDIITYKLAQGTTKEHLLAVAADVYDSWMSHQDGFISWQINHSSEEKFVDVVVWKDKDSADKAQESMNKDLPGNHPWFMCYDFSSISASNVHQLQMWERK